MINIIIKLSNLLILHNTESEYIAFDCAEPKEITFFIFENHFSKIVKLSSLIS